MKSRDWAVLLWRLGPRSRAKGLMQPSPESAAKSKRKVTAILPDSRYMPIFREVQLCYAARNSLPVPWNGRAGAALNRLLLHNPSWDLDTWKRCVRARFESDVNWSEDPVRWLARLTDYARGPLDKYGKPLRNRDFDCRFQEYLKQREKLRGEIESVGDIAGRTVKEQKL